MATYYVDSAATGADDGTSWTDAWVSLNSAYAAGLTAGDIVLVDDGHSQSGAYGNVTAGSSGTLGNPTKILCVDKSDDSISTGAQYTNTNGHVEFSDHQYIYGMTFTASAATKYIGANMANGDNLVFENCTLSSTAITYFGYMNAGAASIKLKDCTIAVNGVGNYYIIGVPRFLMEGGTVSDGKYFATSYDGTNIHLRGVDLTGLTTSIFLANTAGKAQCSWKAERCLLPAGGLDLVNGTPDEHWEFGAYHCQAGTDSDPSYAMTYRTLLGRAQIDTARYRTGGATDGSRSTPYSWDITSGTTQEMYAPFTTIGVSRWTDGDGSTEYTYKIYVAHAILAGLSEDQFWVDLELPNDGATDCKSVIATSKPTLLSASFDNIPTDSSSVWNGTGVGVKQVVSITHTPDKPGLVIARFNLALASTTIYVDPLVEITPTVNSDSRSVLQPGYGMTFEGETDSGSGGGGTVVIPIIRRF